MPERKEAFDGVSGTYLRNGRVWSVTLKDGDRRASVQGKPDVGFDVVLTEAVDKLSRVRTAVGVA